jgi:hypothetical protein
MADDRAGRPAARKQPDAGWPASGRQSGGFVAVGRRVSIFALQRLRRGQHVDRSPGRLRWSPRACFSGGPPEYMHPAATCPVRLVFRFAFALLATDQKVGVRVPPGAQEKQSESPC